MTDTVQPMVPEAVGAPVVPGYRIERDSSGTSWRFQLSAWNQHWHALNPHTIGHVASFTNACLDALSVSQQRAEAAEARVAVLEEACRRITLREGRFSRDQLTHAENTIEDMAEIAATALAAGAARSDDSKAVPDTMACELLDLRQRVAASEPRAAEAVAVVKGLVEMHDVEALDDRVVMTTPDTMATLYDYDHNATMAVMANLWRRALALAAPEGHTQEHDNV